MTKVAEERNMANTRGKIYGQHISEGFSIFFNEVSKLLNEILVFHIEYSSFMALVIMLDGHHQ